MAAAIRYLAKVLLTDGISDQMVQISPKTVECLQGNIASEKGIGREVLAKFLSDVHGIGSKKIEEQLASLKMSGDYARIIQEVKDEIQAENEAELKYTHISFITKLYRAGAHMRVAGHKVAT